MIASKRVCSIGTLRRIVPFAGGVVVAAVLAIPTSATAVSTIPPAAGGEDKASCTEVGPQAPRDITSKAGRNAMIFSAAPPAADMHLCDIHFHQYAEHRASGYTELAGEGDHRGYVCNGTQPAASSGKAQDADEGRSGIRVGDTIEVHWVFTTCDVKPGPKLASCFTAACKNPELRVEARVFHLTADGSGADFASFRTSATGKVTLPEALDPVEYLGSTTGPVYNDGSCSPFQVTWNVGSACRPLEIDSIDYWWKEGENPFQEHHAHGVRRLVTDEALLSPIE